MKQLAEQYQLFYTIHLGENLNISDFNHGVAQAYMESMQRFRNMCHEAIGNADIKICIENTDGFYPYEKEAIELLLNKSCDILM